MLKKIKIKLKKYTQGKRRKRIHKNIQNCCGLHEVLVRDVCTVVDVLVNLLFMCIENRLGHQWLAPFQRMTPVFYENNLTQ